MKKKIFYLLICCLCLPVSMLAQTVQIDQKTDVEKYFSKSRWLFPDFETGTVWLKQSRSQAKLNYDLLTEKIFFIDAKQDTLALVNYKDVVIIQVGQRYLKPYNNYFIEVIARTKDDNELWLKRQLKKTDTEKAGAYGLPTSTSGVASINSINTGGGYFKEIEVKEWSKYSHTVAFYLSDGNNPTTANKKAFLKMFSKQKKQIEAYLSENPVNFEKEEDLKRLLEYCQNL